MYLRKLKDIREDNDLSQKAIAKLLKTTQQNYCRYEIGEREIPLHHLITLADFYGVSLDYLTGREEKR